MTSTACPRRWIPKTIPRHRSWAGGCRRPAATASCRPSARAGRARRVRFGQWRLLWIESDYCRWHPHLAEAGSEPFISAPTPTYKSRIRNIMELHHVSALLVAHGFQPDWAPRPSMIAVALAWRPTMIGMALIRVRHDFRRGLGITILRNRQTLVRD